MVANAADLRRARAAVCRDSGERRATLFCTHCGIMCSPEGVCYPIYHGSIRQGTRSNRWSDGSDRLHIEYTGHLQCSGQKFPRNKRSNLVASSTVKPRTMILPQNSPVVRTRLSPLNSRRETPKCHRPRIPSVRFSGFRPAYRTQSKAWEWARGSLPEGSSGLVRSSSAARCSAALHSAHFSSHFGYIATIPKQISAQRKANGLFIITVLETPSTPLNFQTDRALQFPPVILRGANYRTAESARRYRRHANGNSPRLATLGSLAHRYLDSRQS
jgi:hypothetical protein